MFSNLIESGSHAADLKRKGRFFLGTTLFYGLLLAFAGVGSIYAYNVKLEREADYELVALMRFPAAEARVERQQPRREPARAASPSPGRAPRPAMVTEVSMNTPYPTRVASANTPVLRPGQAYTIGNVNVPGVSGGPVGPDSGGLPEGGEEVGPKVAESVVGGPPPAPTPTPKATPRPETGPVRLTSTVISSKTIEKPAPPYPNIAKVAGVQGPVAVQILVDEQGRVISAKATSGNPLLQPAAVQAAYRARFTPTFLGGQAVKVTGSITYNFVIH